jgi:hypothetical protein
MKHSFIMKANWRIIPSGDIPPQYAGIYVSMNPKGVIAMNRATYKKLDEPTAFFVLFDSVNNRIGLQPTAAGVQNAFHIAKHNRGGAKIHAWRLIRECQIDLAQTIQFQDADIDEDGILILDLRTYKVPKRVTAHFRNRLKRGDKKET